MENAGKELGLLEFVFETSGYAREALLPQISRALEKLTELRSRAKCAIRYCDFTCLIETDDLFLPVWHDNITVLQKRDLRAGEGQGFAAFLLAYPGIEYAHIQ